MFSPACYEVALHVHPFPSLHYIIKNWPMDEWVSSQGEAQYNYRMFPTNWDPIIVLYLLYCSINSCKDRHRYYCWLWTMCLTIMKCLRRNFSPIVIYLWNSRTVSPAKTLAIRYALVTSYCSTTTTYPTPFPSGYQTSPSPSSSASSSLSS